MRIIGGKLKRRIIRVPDGIAARPTMDRVRQQLFDLLLSRMPLESANVLDLFSGTGSFGFEALSRGASQSVFVENNRIAFQTLMQNAKLLGIASKCIIVKMDVFGFLKKTKSQFDVVFADPPYRLNMSKDLIENVLESSLLFKGGYFIFEHETINNFEKHPYLVMSVKSSAKVCLSFFEKK